MFIIATEMIEAMHYKLRCFGFTVYGASEVFCDNKSVVESSSIPISVFFKVITPPVTIE